MKVVSNLAWGILKYIGISRTEDLPPIPDAPIVKTPSQFTPQIQGSGKKQVTFSPNREYIPEYQFVNGTDPSLTPTRLLRELQEITNKPETLEKIDQLVKMVEDLRDELIDLQQENARLQRENKFLREKKVHQSPQLCDNQQAVNCQ